MRNFQFSFWMILGLFVFSMSACDTNKATTGTKIKTTGVQFSSSGSLSEVLEQAAAENKLVFVDFYTTWCLPCRMMDEDVFPDRRLGDFMNENFISYKIDAEKGNGVNLATIYNISGYPTLLFLDQNGNVVERKMGAAYQTELMALGESAMAGVQ